MFHLSGQSALQTARKLAEQLLHLSQYQDDSTLLRVGSRSLRRITEFADHQANGREVHESKRLPREILEVLGQAPTAIEPRNRPFDNPPLGQHHKSFHLITSGDDL